MEKYEEKTQSIEMYQCLNCGQKTTIKIANLMEEPKRTLMRWIKFKLWQIGVKIGYNENT